MTWWGKESPMFGNESKLGGKGTSQYPEFPLGAIPNWKENYQYIKDQEVMDPATGLYYRAVDDHYATEIFADDLANGLWVPMGAGGGGGAVNYSNVAFVDLIHGDNSTAQIGRFDLPFLDIPNALSAVSGTAPTLNNRALVRVRKGLYSQGFSMTDNVDVYCEPGVVFEFGSITSSGVVNASLFGHAKFISGSICIFVLGEHYGTFEFDTLESGTTGIIFQNTSSGNVLVKGNSVTVGIAAPQAISIRGAINVVIDIAKEISCHAEVLNFRFFTGTAVINCPKIKILAGDLYGGNFKAALKINTATNATIEVNGDLICEDDTYYAGISGMIVMFEATTAFVTVNGDIVGFGTPALNLLDVNGSTCTINGNISSDTYIANVTNLMELTIKHSFIHLPDDAATSLMTISGSPRVNLVDCQFFNEVEDLSTIVIAAAALPDLNLYNCIGEQFGIGFFISSTDPAPVKIVSSMATHDLRAGVTNDISSNGFFLEPNVKAVQF